MPAPERPSPEEPSLNPLDKAKDVARAVEHPLDTAKELEREAEEGRSARTPLIAVTGVTIGVGIVFAILLAVALTLYFVYGGK